MRIGVYAEEKELNKEIQNHLSHYFDYCCIEYEINEFVQFSDLTQSLNQHQFQFFIVDLDGTDTDCWEVVEYIRYMDEECPIILLSGDTRNAVIGYREGVSDYLLKPFNPEDMTYSIGRIMKQNQMFRNRGTMVKLKVSGVWTNVNLEHIAYVESSGHSLIFSMTSGAEIKIVASFRDYFPVLNRNPNFLRCHKSFVVNLEYVMEMKSLCFILVDGRTINISRKYKQICKAYYVNYMIHKYVVDTEPSELGAERGILNGV